MKTSVKLIIVGVFALVVFAFVAISAVTKAIGGFADTKQSAEHAVVQFHDQLNAAKYGEIYAQSSDEFKEFSTEEKMTEIFDSLHRKLGTVKNSDLVSWGVNYNLSGKFTTLIYSTEFSEGKATETFIYRSSNGQTALYNYHISSADLITK